jgi:hypothetical protein
LTEEAVPTVVRVAVPAVGPDVEIEAVLTPVARSMAFSRSAMVPDCVYTVELPEPSVTTLPETPDGGTVVPTSEAAVGVAAPVLKVMVWPSTVSVSLLLIVAVMLSEAAAFVNDVAPVMSAGVARLLVAVTPVSVAAVKDVPPNRLAALAPAPRATEKLDLEE